MSQFIFYHIEKCGGTSLRTILYDYFCHIYPKNVIFTPMPGPEMKINYLPNHIDKIKQNKRYDFPNIRVILSHIRYNSFPDLTNQCKYKFICVREPVSRLISHYYYFDYPKTKTHFIDLNAENFKEYGSRYSNHISECFGIKTPNVFEIDKRLKEFDYIAILENLDSELIGLNKSLNNTFNKDIVLKNKKMNISKEKDIKDLKNLISLLEDYCTLDIIVYNRILCLKKTNVID